MEKEGVVYLTFDDGPNSKTTEKILDILKDNDVKATFFITGTGPDKLIKREFDEGHKIALHTASHNYSYIYSSVENYFADLKVVQNRVYKITGHKANIIRFPGGSNNSISNRYCKNIMDELTVEALNRGYLYFDWNVSGGDAGGCRSSKCVYNNVVKHLSKDKTNIILLHDTKKVTVNSLNNIIKYCKSHGYVFKTIDKNTHQVKFK